MLPGEKEWTFGILFVEGMRHPLTGRACLQSLLMLIKTTSSREICMAFFRLVGKFEHGLLFHESEINHTP